MLFPRQLSVSVDHLDLDLTMAMMPLSKLGRDARRDVPAFNMTLQLSPPIRRIRCRPSGWPRWGAMAGGVGLTSRQQSRSFFYGKLLQLR